MSNRNDDDDEGSDIDTEEIKGQLKTMQDALQRHFGHHKVRAYPRRVQLRKVLIRIEKLSIRTCGRPGNISTVLNFLISGRGEIEE